MQARAKAHGFHVSTICNWPQLLIRGFTCVSIPVPPATATSPWTTNSFPVHKFISTQNNPMGNSLSGSRAPAVLWKEGTCLALSPLLYMSAHPFLTAPHPLPRALQSEPPSHLSSAWGCCMPKSTCLWLVLIFQCQLHKAKGIRRTRAPPASWTALGSWFFPLPVTTCLRVLVPRFQRTVGATFISSIYVKCLNLTFIRVIRSSYVINGRVPWWLLSLVTMVHSWISGKITKTRLSP